MKIIYVIIAIVFLTLGVIAGYSLSSSMNQPKIIDLTNASEQKDREISTKDATINLLESTYKDSVSGDDYQKVIDQYNGLVSKYNALLGSQAYKPIHCSSTYNSMNTYTSCY